MKLRQVVPWGFTAIVAVLIGNGVLSQLTARGLTNTVNEVMQGYRVQTSLQALEQVIVDLQLGERGFIITRDPDFLRPYQTAQSNLAQEFARAKTLLQNEPAQLQNLNELEALSNEAIAVLSNNIARVRNGETPSSEELIQGNQVIEQVRVKVAQMLQAESQTLATRKDIVTRAEILSAISTLGGTLLGTLLGLSIVGFVIRQVVQPINQVTLAITSSSTEIAATVAQQEHFATEQATSVHQTNSIMEELGASSRQSAEQAQKTATGAQEVSQLAETGIQAVSYTLEDMSVLKAKVEQIAQQILHLSQQTDRIGNISELVTALANQTNMLALNAAVEAVRAGDSGRGFAIIAEEIRKLADQSKNSAAKIGVLVSDIQKAIAATAIATQEGTQTVENSLKTAEGMAQTFTGVTTAISSVALNNQQISLNAQQQAIAIQQVVSAMNSLNEGAAQTANGISQTKISTQKLNEAALDLQAVV
ncbi:CHASE3 domain-containing protein [Desertifilum sp. FACHB-1129]|nr:methyl-accepting chemotaxis protein [Desertifilum tharense]MBD2311624.1 CHASE3 domain-containing protein [Desertifilum sp. FACHB-1129]MBD2322851.1 CHASE3 domain-containing protein [Desertifilum sp. FACHB-866]MBD2332755.1 CHASE3 domain-containing protein [Desertifilum sp. FACHB-868]MDA0209350.1 methyl-accepting chemotaxis protein [Cyanobacteria bacterium FC1]